MPIYKLFHLCEFGDDWNTNMANKPKIWGTSHFYSDRFHAPLYSCDGFYECYMLHTIAGYRGTVNSGI